MFSNIIVGIDEHQGGRDAAALAVQLLAENGRLTFAHIYAGDARIRRAASAEHDAVGRMRAYELLEDARRRSDVEAALHCLASSSVGRGMHELAERLEADLLVLGSCRRGPLGRVLVGDDTRAALSGAPCAVAVAPVGYADELPAMREIGVGYDGSPESRHALALARRLAAEHGAKLSAFEAVSLPASAFSGAPLPLGDSIDELLGDARAELSELGGLEPHVAYGKPAEELALYSASLDLLVVGSRGYGAVGLLFHGSTSQQLARLARCPLLVLTRGARPTTDASAATPAGDVLAAVSGGDAPGAP